MGQEKSGASIYHPSSVAGVSDCEQRRKSKAAMAILSCPLLPVPSAFYFRCSTGNRSHPSLGQLVKESPLLSEELAEEIGPKTEFRGTNIHIGWRYPRTRLPSCEDAVQSTDGVIGTWKGKSVNSFPLQLVIELLEEVV